MVLNGIPWLDREGRLRDDPLSITENGRLKIAGRSSGDIATSIAADVKRIVVPGYVDCHVHFREPGQEYKEGIANGCLAAIVGGVTTVLDMPNNLPPTDSAASLAEKRLLWSAQGRVGWGLFLAGSKGASPSSLKVDPAGIAGLKVFMASSGSCSAITDPEILARLLLAWPRIAIHAEDESVFPADSFGLNHQARRPRSAIVSALSKLSAAFAIAELLTGEKPGCRMVLLHVSTREEVDWVRQMKKRGYAVFAETCPHYLFFTAADEAGIGAHLQVNPPLRDKDDQTILWQAVADGTIDLVSSDHAPHTPEEKACANSPSGIPGIERMWPLLALAVEQGRLDWRQAVALAAVNAAECYDLPGRDGLVDNNRADLVVLRRSAGMGANRVITHAGYDIYRRFKFPWEVERVLIAGKTVWEQSKTRVTSPAEEVYANRSIA